MPKPVYAPLGPVSSDSNRPEDLLSAYTDLLSDLRQELGGTDRRRADRIDALLGGIHAGLLSQEEYFASEESDWDLAEIQEALEGFAPPFAYFGTAPGDGSCFGFWVDRDALQEAVADGSVILIPAGSGWPEDELRERPGVEGVLRADCDKSNVAEGWLFAPLPDRPFMPLWRR